MNSLHTLSAEERLKGLRPEERLKGLQPEERLNGLRPEERLKGLRPEDIEILKNLLMNMGPKQNVGTSVNASFR